MIKTINVHVLSSNLNKNKPRAGRVLVASQLITSQLVICQGSRSYNNSYIYIYIYIYIYHLH